MDFSGFHRLPQDFIAFHRISIALHRISEDSQDHRTAATGPKDHRTTGPQDRDHRTTGQDRRTTGPQDHGNEAGNKKNIILENPEIHGFPSGGFGFRGVQGV